MNKKTIFSIVVIALVLGAIIFIEIGKNKEGDYSNPTVVLDGSGNNELNANDGEMESDEPFQWTNPDADKFKPDPNSKYPIAPDLEGIAGWINAEPFSLKELRGKVVIVDFWTYSCINCIRTLPYLVEWDKKYRDDGLVIIGVHSPEFAFEKDIDNVLKATKRHGVEYPVVQDNDFKTWRAYQNRYWPHKFLIDANGHIRYDHIGEGGYEETEVWIQELLSEIGVKKEGGLVDVDEQTPNTRNTRELYAGYDFALPRGQDVANGGMIGEQTKEYVLPSEEVDADKIYLEGTWKSNADNLEAVSDGAIVLKFTARSANIVSDVINEAVNMNVLINGEYVAKSDAGSDVVYKDDEAFVIVDEAKLYNVFDSSYGTRTLRLEVTSGFTFHAFTFG